MSCKTGVQDLTRGQTRVGIKVVGLGQVDSLKTRLQSASISSMQVVHFQVTPWTLPPPTGPAWQGGQGQPQDQGQSQDFVVARDD